IFVSEPSFDCPLFARLFFSGLGTTGKGAPSQVVPEKSSPTEEGMSQYVSVGGTGSISFPVQAGTEKSSPESAAGLHCSFTMNAGQSVVTTAFQSSGNRLPAITLDADHSTIPRLTSRLPAGGATRNTNPTS